MSLAGGLPVEVFRMGQRVVPPAAGGWGRTGGLAGEPLRETGAGRWRQVVAVVAAGEERGSGGRAVGDDKVELWGFVGEEADLVGAGVDLAEGLIRSEREGEREPLVSGFSEAFNFPQDREQGGPVIALLA